VQQRLSMINGCGGRENRQTGDRIVGRDEAVVILTHAIFDERHYLRHRLGGGLGLTLQLLQLVRSHAVGVERFLGVNLTLEHPFLQDLGQRPGVGNFDKSGANGHQLVAAQSTARSAHHQADDVRWELELEARLLRHLHLRPTPLVTCAHARLYMQALTRTTCQAL